MERTLLVVLILFGTLMSTAVGVKDKLDGKDFSHTWAWVVGNLFCLGLGAAISSAGWPVLGAMFATSAFNDFLSAGYDDDED